MEDLRFRNLTKSDLNPNPFKQFEEWFSFAKKKRRSLSRGDGSFDH